MRTLLYSKPEGAEFALYDLGISTGEWEDKGKLIIEDEAVLKERIENNIDEIRELFSDSENGIMVKFNKVIKDTASVSSGSPGSLVNLAGVKGKATESENTISKDIKDVEEKITSLKELYEREKTRYWNKFTAMETLISNMNSQSSWLAQMFA